MPRPLKILFGKKYTAQNFEEILEVYWERSQSDQYDLVVFDLRELEWIALEEITFLFGWFRQLLIKGQQIKILLPDYYGDYKKHNSLKNLWGKWKIYSFYYDLVPKPSILEDYFTVDEHVNNIIKDQVRKSQFDQENIDDDITVVPFQHLSAYGYGNVRSIDDLIVNKIHKPLNLSKQVYDVLRKHTDISAKDNLLLSKIVTNELFLNALHHAFQTNQNSLNECYFAIALKRKFTIENIIKSEDSRKVFEQQKTFGNFHETSPSKIAKTTEKDAAEKMDFLLKTVLPNGYENERISETLDFFQSKNSSDYKYKNETYIEFTFLDFGQGIPTSLRQFYLNDIADNRKKEMIFSDLNELHFLQNEDTRVLEYAFLINSSRDPFDLEYQVEYEIPRGLYYLLDVVRRHGGLIVARSRYGKIIYNFSNSIGHIKDAVIYTENDNIIGDFHGTMITIVIPASQDFQKTRGAVLPPYIIPDQILNRESYYYTLIELVTEVEREVNTNNIPLQVLYKGVFDKITDIFFKHKSTPSLILFDFSGLDILPLKHKLLFYFASSPNVNRQTSAVLLNFSDTDIIDDVRSSIKYKLKNSQGANYIYKPVPIINSDDEIYWLAVPNEDDEKLLTELLQYEDHHLSKGDLHDFDNYKGSFFSIDKFGNITAKTPTKNNILDLAKKYGKNK